MDTITDRTGGVTAAVRVLAVVPAILLGVALVPASLLVGGVTAASAGGGPAATYSAYGWGSDSDFQACEYQGNAQDGSAQVPVQGLSSVTQVAAGPDFALYLQSDGDVLGCGYDRDDELGDGGVPLGDGYETTPATPTGLPTGVVTEIAAGDSNGYALTSTGAVYAWGSESQGGVGNGAVNDSDVGPTELTTLPPITQIAADGGFAMALGENGHVYTWGMDQSGEIGNGGTFGETTDPVALPYEVAGLSNVTSIAAGRSVSGATFEEHTLAVSGGAVYAWGADDAGQLGNGTTEAGDSTPTAVTITGPGDTPVTVTSVAAGGDDSFAVTSTGTVYAWGGDGYGVLGDGTTGATDTPLLLSGLSAVAQLSAGAEVTSALTTDGTLYTWGQVLFDPTVTSPEVTVAPIGVTSIADGYDTYFAVAENPSSVSQTVASTTLAEGATGQLHATATFAAGGLVAAGTVDATAAADWTTDDDSIADVSAAGIATAEAASGSATITATVGGESGTSTVSDVPSGISLEPARLPAATAAASYSTTLGATGGTAPYTFQVVDGTLPRKVTLTSAGLLSGKPLTGATDTFTVQATDADGLFSTASYTLVVVLPVGPSRLEAGKLHVAYHQQLTASHGTAPYGFKVRSGKLPPGLELSGGGALTGKPTRTGRYRFSVGVTDHSSPPATGERSYQVLVTTH